MSKDPWEIQPWRAECEALQAQLIMLVGRARKAGCSFEVLAMEYAGEGEVATGDADGLDVAPPDGTMPAEPGLFARFFPDPDLLDENFHPGVVSAGYRAAYEAAR